MKKFLLFVRGEIINLSVGYLAGLGASSLVSRYFVKKGMANLWGLTAKKEAVSRDNYDWLLFIASYGIGLAVMLTVNYLMQRYVTKKEEGAA